MNALGSIPGGLVRNQRNFAQWQRESRQERLRATLGNPRKKFGARSVSSGFEPGPLSTSFAAANIPLELDSI